MQETTNKTQNDIIVYYTDLVKYTFLKENEKLGINARNKIIAKYNRLIQEEQKHEMNAEIIKIANFHTLESLSVATYIKAQDNVSELIKIYADIQVFICLKHQFHDQKVDPMQVLSVLDPTIWTSDNLQNYANVAHEYNKYKTMLSKAILNINKQTSITST